MAKTYSLYINLWIYQLVISSQTVPWPWPVSNYNMWDEQEEQSLHAQNRQHTLMLGKHRQMPQLYLMLYRFELDGCKKNS